MSNWRKYLGYSILVMLYVGVLLLGFMLDEPGIRFVFLLIAAITTLICLVGLAQSLIEWEPK